MKDLRLFIQKIITFIPDDKISVIEFLIWYEATFNKIYCVKYRNFKSFLVPEIL